MNNTLKIRQNQNGAKVFFLNGKIENVNILYEGYSANNKINKIRERYIFLFISII